MEEELTMNKLEEKYNVPIFGTGSEKTSTNFH